MMVMRDGVHALFRRNCLTGLAMISLIAGFPTFVFAHATLIRVNPAVDTTVAKRPSEIHLWFSESVERRFSRITVHRAMRDATTGEIQAQEEVDTGLSSGPRVTTELAVKLPETLRPGLYLVQWKVLSIDSHRTTGKFTLTYDPASSGVGEIKKTKPKS
jgi:copper resistance protein C